MMLSALFDNGRQEDAISLLKLNCLILPKEYLGSPNLLVWLACSLSKKQSIDVREKLNIQYLPKVFLVETMTNSECKAQKDWTIQVLNQILTKWSDRDITEYLTKKFIIIAQHQDKDFIDGKYLYEIADRAFLNDNLDVIKELLALSCMQIINRQRIIFYNIGSIRISV